MPTNQSYPNEPAIGICDNCGAIVHFQPNEHTTKCPVCWMLPTRMSSGAVSPNSQAMGYRVGAGVVPRNPR